VTARVGRGHVDCVHQRGGTPRKERRLVAAMRPNLIVVPLLSLTLGGCPKALDGETSVACARDADCPSPACGPCTSGARLVRNGPTCAVNPCPGVQVACSPEKVCVAK